MSALPFLPLAFTIAALASCLPAAVHAQQAGDDEADAALALLSSAYPGSRARAEFSEIGRDGLGASFGRTLVVSMDARGGGGSDPLVIFLPVARGDDPDGPWTAALAELCARLEENPAALPVKIVFSAAEDEEGPGGERLALGSTLLAERFSLDGSPVVLALEPGPGRSVSLAPGATGGMAPFWLLVRSEDAFARFLEVSVEANRSLVHRLGINAEPTIIDAWMGAGIPAIAVALEGDGEVPSAETLADALERWTRSFGPEGPPARWDRQYLLAEVFGLRITLREGAIVAILLGFGAIAGALYAVATVLDRERMNPRFRRAPAGLAATLALYAVLLAATGVARLSASARLFAAGSAFAWLPEPGRWAAVQVAVLALVFIALASALARHKVTPAHPGFYWTSAVVLVVVGIFTLAAYRLSLAAFLLPALVAFALTRLSGRAWAAALALPFAFAPLALVEAGRQGRLETGIASFIVLPGSAEAALIAVMALPFLLHLMGLLAALVPGVFARRAPARTALALALVLVAADALVLRLDTRPVGAELRLERTGEAWTLVVSARRRLPAFELEMGGRTVSHRGGDDRVAFDLGGDLAAFRPAPKVELTERSFLDSGSLDLRASAPGAERMAITLPGIDPTLVQHCDRPSDFDPGASGFAILLGRLPPDLVLAGLALAGGTSGTVEVRAEWTLDPALVEAEGALVVESFTLADSASADFGRP
ncbi:MAG: hypothetical protein JXA15_14685 [Spirochaetales bacterium]|nr:hypothetical protein [Spirochaetales bacterium]